MSEVLFHATRMGRTYYERDVPELIRQLKRIGDGVEGLVELQVPEHSTAESDCIDVDLGSRSTFPEEGSEL